MEKNKLELQQELVALALEMGADNAKVLHMSEVCFDPRTTLKCLFGCKYNEYFCPMAKDPALAVYFREAAQKYKWGIIIRTREKALGQNITLALEKKAFLADYPFAMGFTSCAHCPKCALAENAPCRDKSKPRLPLYALGIDVYSTVRGLGWELNVLQSQDCQRANITAVLVE